MSGKGDKPRPFTVSHEEYSNNFDRIFRNKNLQKEEQEKVEEFGRESLDDIDDFKLNED